MRDDETSTVTNFCGSSIRLLIAVFGSVVSSLFISKSSATHSVLLIDTTCSQIDLTSRIKCSD